jgi:hypothetical protein
MIALMIVLALQQEAVVTAVEGDVEFRQPSKSKKWAKLAKEAKLAIGDQVQTGLKSKCLLRVGEATMVLIRSSSFATLSRSFIEKNTVEGELRLDVGSVFIEVDDQKPEKVDFKVSTPMGTASIRGSGMIVTFSELGMDVQQTQGTIFAQRGRGPESRLTEHARLKHFAQLTGGDLSALIGLMIHLHRLRDGEPPLQTLVSGMLHDRTFRSTLDFNQAGQDIGFSQRPRFQHTGTQFSCLTIGPFIKWGFQFIGGTQGFNIAVLSTIGRAQFNTANNQWFGFVGPQQIWFLRDVGGAGPQWVMTFQNGKDFLWNPLQTSWIPQ